MQPSIENLDDATAIRVLRAFATARGRHGSYQTKWSNDLRQALVEGIEGAGVTAAVNEGDLAREALLLLAGDPDDQEPLTALIESASPESFMGPGTMAVGVAALIALQTHVKFERTKDGKIHFKIEKNPLPTDLLKKLISFFTDHPSGEI
jgi:hypothetical protein